MCMRSCVRVCVCVCVCVCDARVFVCLYVSAGACVCVSVIPWRRPFICSLFPQGKRRPALTKPVHKDVNELGSVLESEVYLYTVKQKKKCTFES